LGTFVRNAQRTCYRDAGGLDLKECQEAFMNRERELERLHGQEFRLRELMMKLPEGASVPSEDAIAAMVEMEELRNELEFLQNDASDSGERDAFVGAPVKPLPHLNSGAVALPESDKPDR
jgi:hypothetical protein